MIKGRRRLPAFENQIKSIPSFFVDSEAHEVHEAVPPPKLSLVVDLNERHSCLPNLHDRKIRSC
jgi:hypothetical protein